MQLFAQVATFLSSLFASSTDPQRQGSPISSPAAPVSDVNTTSTLNPTPQNLLRVMRDPAKATTDALFGEMSFNGQILGCTMERTAVAIPEGVYQGAKRYSPHFGMTVVGIAVPNRTNIECHPANLPAQLEGCIAIGESIDGDALDNSRKAFDAMMEVVPNEFTVEICSL